MSLSSLPQGFADTRTARTNEWKYWKHGDLRNSLTSGVLRCGPPRGEQKPGFESTERMRTLTATIRSLAFVAAGLVLVGGCTSQEQMANDVGLSRQAAYRQWENQKTREAGQQPRISGQLSVTDAFKLALVHNKMLQQTLLERDVAEGQLVSSRSAYLPNVALSAQYRRQEFVPVFDVAGPGGTTQRVQIGTLDNYSAALNITQPVYAGGAITAQVQLARLSSLLADQTVRAATQDVVYATETAYYNLLLSQHLVDISTEEVRAAKVHLEDVEKKRAGGVASNFDVLRAQVELSNSEADLIRSKNAINIARADLIKTMGVSQDSNFVLSDTFVFAPTKVPMEEAVKTAFTNRPDLYSSEYQIRQQREQLRIARSRYLPNVSLYFTDTWSNPSPTSFGSSANEWGRIWQGGAQAAWPIFDGFQREARHHAAESPAQAGPDQPRRYGRNGRSRVDPGDLEHGKRGRIRAIAAIERDAGVRGAAFGRRWVSAGH